jgi:hypothetical protein
MIKPILCNIYIVNYILGRGNISHFISSSSVKKENSIQKPPLETMLNRVKLQLSV